MATTGIERFFLKPAKFININRDAADQELQNKLYGLFLGLGGVSRAYLSGVHYESAEQEQRLALCLIADRANAERTADAIAKVFKKIYSDGSRLDILFVSDAQEHDVKRVAEPFFEQ